MQQKGRLDITPYAKNITEISGGSCEKFLFEMNGKKFVFKQNFERNEVSDCYFVLYFDDNISELHDDVAEVFSSYFLKELGCDFCLPYQFASFNGKNGCISPYFENDKGKNKFDFLSILQNLEKKKIIPQNSFDAVDDDFEHNYLVNCNGQYFMSVEQVLEKTEEFCKNYGFDFDKKSTQKKLEKMVVYDFFMANKDRTWRNVVFTTQNKNSKKILKLAPLFDNGEAFGVEDFDRSEHDKLKNYCLELGLTEAGRLCDFEDNKYFENQKLVAIDIFNLAKQDKYIKQIVEKCTTLNFGEFLNKFEKDCGVKLKKEHKTEMERAFNFQVCAFNTATKNLEKRLKKSAKKTNSFEK